MSKNNNYPIKTFTWSAEEVSKQIEKKEKERKVKVVVAIITAFLLLSVSALGAFLLMNETPPNIDQCSSSTLPSDSSTEGGSSSEDNSSSSDSSSSEDSSSSSDSSSSEDSSSSNDSSSSEDSSSSGSSDGPGGGDHLKGSATLNRIGLTGYRLEGGTMVAFTDNSTVDFSNATSENLFGIREGETIVPGCKFTATMSLVNDGAFALDYWMELRMPEEYFDLELAKQLKVTLTVGGKEYTTVVGNPIGDHRAPLGRIEKGESVTFTVSVEFIESADNNLSQGQTVAFDLYVTTTQA